MDVEHRHTERVTITKVEDGTVEWGDGLTGNTCFGGVPEEHLPTLTPGAEVLVETVQGSLVTGMALVHGSEGSCFSVRWLWRKSDEDLARERQQ